MCEHYAQVDDNYCAHLAGGSSVGVDGGVQDGMRVGGGDGEGDESQCPSASPAGFGCDVFQAVRAKLPNLFI